MEDRLREITLETQKEIFRLALFDHGLGRKDISQKSGIQYERLGTYARGEHVIPITELLRLVDVIPDKLLSRLFDPVNRCIDMAQPMTALDRLTRIAADAKAIREDLTGDGE